MSGVLDHVVVRSPGPLPLAFFWARLLGGRIAEPAADRAMVLAPGGQRLAFESGPGASSRLALRVPSVERGADHVLRLGGHLIGEGVADPDGNEIALLVDPTVELPGPDAPRFRRYVAIGDSSTEGLVDGDGTGGWRGWADRFAAHLASNGSPGLEYANLAVSGLRLADIRARQFDAALALRPDVMTIVGGINDVIGLRPDFGAIADDLNDMFARSRAAGIRVLTFTNPDLARANPLATVVRERLLALNRIVREAALLHDVSMIDFEYVAMASDPRLWGEDRLHINTLGHTLVGAALAWLVGLPGSDRDWATDLDLRLAAHPRPRIGDHLHWTMRHLGPWVVSGIRGPQYRQGREPKRPDPVPVNLERERHAT
ncbi:GDSL-type esterase/lipase family protein [Naumannella cuiyingiana]|uniref:Lysophospholipase L1-like esterase n=1 Tax=Naumannella cuiyingiana TaxID=1347891 RepID=A0A7Z0D9J4_9ACTN|nr:GDSL-type esterase/lipase family protein [Naumannella cuiyingiana]NYI71266.1 lysophospholipase L1-like esterase [Naumannella cuiyingiana]